MTVCILSLLVWDGWFPGSVSVPAFPSGVDGVFFTVILQLPVHSPIQAAKQLPLQSFL